VADDPTAAVIANGGEGLDGTFEAIESVHFTEHVDLKGFIIIVAAGFAPGHLGSSFRFLSQTGLPFTTYRSGSHIPMDKSFHADKTAISIPAPAALGVFRWACQGGDPSSCLGIARLKSSNLWRVTLS
jgi:hypothetical protein